MFVKCEKCGKDMPEERLELYKTCILCTPQVRRVGFMSFDHKTAPTLVMVDASDAEAVRLAQRAHRRAR